MALGKEGPLVHVACCWANALADVVPKSAGRADAPSGADALPFQGVNVFT